MSNEVLVVIGVGGMGEVIARRQGVGRTTVIADVDEAALERVAQAMQIDGCDVVARLVDVSSEAAVRELASVAASVGPVRQVVHTAGLSPTQASTEEVLAVDAAGVAFVIDAFGEVIAEGGAGVVIASMAGTMAGTFPPEVEAALRSTPAGELLALPVFAPEAVPNPGAAYSIAKRANQLRVQAASIAWGARGARINSVSPGTIATPMGHLELAGESGVIMRAMIDGSGTGRVGSPTDIANAVSFLLSPESSFITGTDLLVDGGQVAAVASGVLQQMFAAADSAE